VLTDEQRLEQKHTADKNYSSRPEIQERRREWRRENSERINERRREQWHERKEAFVQMTAIQPTPDF